MGLIGDYWHWCLNTGGHGNKYDLWWVPPLHWAEHVLGFLIFVATAAIGLLAAAAVLAWIMAALKFIGLSTAKGFRRGWNH